MPLEWRPLKFCDLMPEVLQCGKGVRGRNPLWESLGISSLMSVAAFFENGELYPVINFCPTNVVSILVVVVCDRNYSCLAPLVS